MKLCPKCGETKTLDNFTKSARTKDGLRCWCRGCTKAGNASWRAKNLETWASYSAKWKAADPEHALELERARYARDPQKAIAKTRDWQKRHPGEASVLEVVKRSRREVVPDWADVAAIGEVYSRAHEISEMVGERFVHVDHIVPLNSPYVSGFHVHQNLEILRGEENVAKGNSFWPDMWPITDEVKRVVAQGVGQ